MLDEEEFKLESFIDDNEVLASATFGSMKLTHDVEDIYLKVYEDLQVPKTSLKITYDSANGANYLISKKVLNLLHHIFIK